jgi:hypothetical protein
MNPSYAFIFLIISFSSIAMRNLQVTGTCPDGVLSYRLRLIEAYVNPPQPGCTVAFSFTTGSCAFSSTYMQELNSGYVCYNQAGPLCATISSTSITGTAIFNCSNRFTSVPLTPVNNFPIGQEFSINSTAASASIMVNGVCKSASGIVTDIQSKK